MDIAALSTSLANMDVMGQVSTAMLAKTMDLGEDLAGGLVQMIDAAAMERSVNPGVGENIDIRV